LAHTGPRELDGHPLGGCGSGLWFSSRLYYPFGKGPGQHIIRALKIKSVGTNKATNGNQNYQKKIPQKASIITQKDFYILIIASFNQNRISLRSNVCGGLGHK